MEEAHSLYWEEMMAQRDQITRMRAEEFERMKLEEKHRIKKLMIIARRELEDPESVDPEMPDYREEHDDFRMELLLELEERQDQRRLINDESYYDDRGNYVRLKPWKNRLHYDRRNDER